MVLMAAGEDAFRQGQVHARKAAEALDGGELEVAKVHAQLADAQSRLALAAAMVLTSDRDEAGTYRLAVGSLGIS